MVISFLQETVVGNIYIYIYSLFQGFAIGRNIGRNSLTLREKIGGTFIFL